jgi:hypothetical protein
VGGWVVGWVAGWLVKSDFSALFGHPIGWFFLWAECGKNLYYILPEHINQFSPSTFLILFIINTKILFRLIAEHFKVNSINLVQLLNLLSVNILKILQADITSCVLHMGLGKLSILFCKSSYL